MTRSSSKLDLARRTRLLVKFFRPFEQGSFNGYVLDIGARFFLLLVVEDACRFNGFSCLRLADVRKLEAPARYAGFAEAALKKCGQRAPRKSRVTVDTIDNLIESAAGWYPLITIHREIVNADVCAIGRVVDIRDGCVSLLEIGPDGKWEHTPTVYRLKDITRVDFGGAYENALYAVGGRPPLGAGPSEGVRTAAGRRRRR
jgi:hypothetical protein